MRFFPFLIACLLLGLASCSSWTPAAEYDGWTLYVQSGDDLELAPYEAAVVPAILAVEDHLGPFQERVRIHAWEGGVDMVGGNRVKISGDGGAVENIPGIGPARVRAFHSSSGGGLSSTSGVFVGTPEPGTMVHELVHARFSERPDELPLWFEEGYASLLGDGVLKDGQWTVDGLACWPWRELRDEELTADDLRHLLSIKASESHTLRDNVLVHFVGWAIVFDMHRETGLLDPDLLLQHWQHSGDPIHQARERLDRTLADSTPHEWLGRLSDPDPAVRMAAAKGTWKLASRDAVKAMLRALEDEDDTDVRVTYAINCLATAGERRLSWRLDMWLWRSILPVLRRAELPDPAEQDALRNLYRSYRRGRRRSDSQDSLNALRRFWQE